MTRVLSPTCQDCLPSLKPKGKCIHRQGMFPSSSSAEEPAAMVTHLIEFWRLLICRHRQRGQLWPRLGVAHVMYGVIFVNLWETGTKLLFRNWERLLGLWRGWELQRSRESDHTVLLLRPLHPLHTNASVFKSLVCLVCNLSSLSFPSQTICSFFYPSGKAQVLSVPPAQPWVGLQGNFLSFLFV